MEQTMPPVNYKPYKYKGTPEEDAQQADRIRRIEAMEKLLDNLKKESRNYIYKTEAGRV